MYNLYVLIDFESAHMKLAVSEFGNCEGKILLKMNSIAGFEYFPISDIYFIKCSYFLLNVCKYMPVSSQYQILWVARFTAEKLKERYNLFIYLFIHFILIWRKS